MSLSDKTSPFLKVFYDGDCPLCSREIKHLKHKAQKRMIFSILFVDIAASDFQPELHGRSMEQFMGELHVYRQGEFLLGMAAVRALYEHLGMGKWMSWTAVPVIKPICDASYKVFARLRPRLNRGNRCLSSCNPPKDGKAKSK